jgi:GTP-binding protein HflX
MNLCTGANLESKDLLFQTLNTTHKRFRLPNGQHSLMLDTVGFITNLPHGLIESFKATLEEIHFADLLVHVRDISHPQTQYQRDTVVKVLKEIGIPEEVLQRKYVEVWNKIDLIQDQQGWVEDIKQEMVEKEQEYPVVMMSCKDGTNKELFLNEVQALTQVLMGKKPIELKYSYRDHEKVTKWLFEHASITAVDDMTYGEDGSITLRVPIDEITYQKYLKHFET